MNLERVTDVLVTNVTADNTGTTLATMIDGDLLLLDKTMSDLTGTPVITDANAESVYFALGDSNRSDGFRLAGPVDGRNLKSWKKLVFQAPVEQSTIVGHNGTANALALDDNTEYRLRIAVPDRHNLLPHQPREFDFYHVTATSANQFDAADDFAKKINADTRGLRIKFDAHVLGDGTITEFGAGIDATVTNNSKTVTTAIAHGRAVGDLLIITPVADGINSVYKVGAVPSTTEITLTRAFRGTSRVILIASTTDDFAILTVNTEIGIRIDSLAILTRTYSGGVNLDNFQQIQFSVGLGKINGLPGTEETITQTEHVPGQGFAAQIQDMEIAAMGWLGFTNRVLFPVPDANLNAVLGNQYTMYVLEYFSEINTGQGVSRDPKAVVLCFKSDVTTKLDTMEAIIDSWVVSAGLPAV